MTIPKTETQKTIESNETRKAKMLVEITGMTDCKAAINAATVKTAYMKAQVAAYGAKIAGYNDQITEIDVMVTKLNA